MEYLHAVVFAIANIDQAVGRNNHTMNRIAELLIGWFTRHIRFRRSIVRHVAVGAPMPLVLSSVRVEDDYAMVAVAIGNIEFVRRLVDKLFGGRFQVIGVIAAFA